MNTKTPLKWKQDGDGRFHLKDAKGGIYALLERKSRAWRTTPFHWETCIPHVHEQGREGTACNAKIKAKKAVLKLLAMTPEERRCYIVIAYAKTKGVSQPTVAKDPTYGWILYGDELNTVGYPIVWEVAKDLGIWRGVGSTGQCQVNLTKLNVP